MQSNKSMTTQNRSTSRHLLSPYLPLQGQRSLFSVYRVLCVSTFEDMHASSRDCNRSTGGAQPRVTPPRCFPQSATMSPSQLIFRNDDGRAKSNGIRSKNRWMAGSSRHGGHISGCLSSGKLFPSVRRSKAGGKITYRKSCCNKSPKTSVSSPCGKLASPSG